MAIKIFIDQGHNPGTINAGAQGNGLQEQEVNYNVGTYLANILNADPRFEARTARTSPTEVLGTNNTSSLAKRVQMANSWPADYFLSIHSNFNNSPAINGSEAYVFEANSQGYYLGNQILQEIVRIVGTKNNGIYIRPSLYVLRYTRMPAALIELGYLSNAADAQKLRDNQYQFASAIYSGLLKFFGLQPLQKK
ncbi:N-acetylmuramoyl-L-alanine amidase family protein [Anaeromicropila herbilytica]|uniref:MurNAc-LAA domain-containing protein n=1 Tax=Anaeromicropila herbilytica TaxID=2785025 RepID=A0A7R7EMX4_9FIRM|nr:N-acetylmuramoyl-L-alanine amidase [Anaeromicropila herbilytica]BCN31764.1 hypothetical protein bsdtb5_30590 [Anaeromicropila herbilytica]